MKKNNLTYIYLSFYFFHSINNSNAVSTTILISPLPVKPYLKKQILMLIFMMKYGYQLCFFFKTRRLLLTKNLKEKNWNLLYVLCPKYISPSDITFFIYSVKTNNKVHQKECQTYFQNQITSANKTSGSYWFISWYRSWFVTYNQIVCFLYNCASISIIISFAIVPFHENYTD